MDSKAYHLEIKIILLKLTVISQGFHTAWEGRRIMIDGSVWVSLQLPTVIDVLSVCKHKHKQENQNGFYKCAFVAVNLLIGTYNVVVPDFAETSGDKRRSCVSDDLFINFAVVMIPKIKC